MTTSSTPYPISRELGRLLALRRVHRGHVLLVGHDLLLDHEHRVPDYLRASLRELLDGGYLSLGEERAEWRQRPVLATASGEQLHTKLEALPRERGRRRGLLPEAAAASASRSDGSDVRISS